MDNLESYLRLKDLRRDALKSKDTKLADQYLEDMNQIYDQLSKEERWVTFTY